MYLASAGLELGSCLPYPPLARLKSAHLILKGYYFVEEETVELVVWAAARLGADLVVWGD